MTPIIFEAEIQAGQVVPSDGFKHFEGRRVRITVDLPPASNEAKPKSVDSLDRDIDIEKDVYVKIPFGAHEVLPGATVRTRSLPPCVIIPEELPDD